MSGEVTSRFEMLGRAAIVGPQGERTSLRSGQVAAILGMLWDEDRPVRRDELAELLWGEGELPAHWAGAVRGVFVKARDVLDRAGLGRDVLQVEGGTASLVVPSGAITDLAEAELLVEQATSALRAGEHESACGLAQAAQVLLVEPVALGGEGEWIRRLHLRVATNVAEARRIEIKAQLALGRLTETIAAAEAAILFDPLDEVAHELLIRAHLVAGHPVAARRAHAELSRTLDQELGIPPDPALSALLVSSEPSTPAPSQPKSPQRPTHSVRFLGRVEELESMRRCSLDVIESGRPGLIVVEGPAGIGKTRLVRAFVEQQNARAHWGRCRSGSGVPFEPFAEAFRRALEANASDLAVPAKSIAAGLARLLPDQDSSKTTRRSADHREAVVRDVVTTTQVATGEEMMVLVIDDLQWASGDTLALVARLLEDCAAPVLVVATVREGSAEPGAIADVLRAAPATVLPLGGITSEDLLPLAQELLEFTDEEWTEGELARQLHDRTGGLAFYIVELAREIRRQRKVDAQAIPETVRTWIRRRVEALPEQLADLLEVASVIGIRPQVGLVEQCWDGPSQSALSGLERMVRAGFLTETTSPEHLAFPHQITREVVEAGIGSTRRARLHGRVASALADLEGGNPPYAVLAYHLSLAGPQRRRDAALQGYRAGAESLSRSAWDLADEQLTTALERCGTDDPVLRASLLIALGRTRHVLGFPPEAVALLNEAITLSTQHRLPHHLARATLLLVGRGGRGAALGMADGERIALLDTALEAATTLPIPDGLPDVVGFRVDEEFLGVLRTALEVELAWASLFVATFEARRTLLEGTLARARSERAGPSRLARALVAQRNVLQAPGDLVRRLAVMDEVLTLPADEVASETLVAMHLGRHEDLLGLGDRVGARDALDEARVVAEKHGHPYWRWAVETWNSLSFLVDGDPDAAESALAASRGLQPAGSPEVDACHIVQLVAIRLHQGRADEVVDVVHAAADLQPQIPGYRAVLALCQVHAGDLAGADISYRHFADQGFANVPVDSNRLLTVAVLGDVAVALGDAEGAKILDAVLAPDDGYNVVLNCYGGGGAWWGPVSRIRGELAALAEG